MNGPPPTPAATCRLASSPMPFVHVCGVNQRLRGQRELGDRRGRGASRRRGRRRAGGRRTRRRRRAATQLGEGAGHLAAGDADPRRRRPQRRQTASGRCRPAAPRATGRRSSASRTAISRAATGSSERRRVAGHPPALVEVDHDRHRIADRARGSPRRPRGPPRAGAGRPGSSARVKPSSRSRSARLGARRRPAAASRTRRTPGCRRRAAEQRRDRQIRRPGRRCPTARPRAASTGRRGSRSSRATRTWRAIASGSLADEQVLERLEAVHRVARSRCRRRPRRSRPGRSSPRTTRRGTGSQAAGNGGSSGRTRRSRRMRGDAHVRSIAQSPRRASAVAVDSGMGRQYRSETLRSTGRKQWPGRRCRCERCRRVLVAARSCSLEESETDGLSRSWTRFAGQLRRCSSTWSRRSPPGD